MNKVISQIKIIISHVQLEWDWQNIVCLFCLGSVSVSVRSLRVFTRISLSFSHSSAKYCPILWDFNCKLNKIYEENITISRHVAVTKVTTKHCRQVILAHVQEMKLVHICRWIPTVGLIAGVSWWAWINWELFIWRFVHMINFRISDVWKSQPVSSQSPTSKVETLYVPEIQRHDDNKLVDMIVSGFMELGPEVK